MRWFANSSVPAGSPRRARESSEPVLERSSEGSDQLWRVLASKKNEADDDCAVGDAFWSSADAHRRVVLLAPCCESLQGACLLNSSVCADNFVVADRLSGLAAVHNFGLADATEVESVEEGVDGVRHHRTAFADAPMPK